MAFHDLSTLASRANLVPGPRAYWHLVQQNRHLGIRVNPNTNSVWVARCRTVGQQYREMTLGVARVPGQLGGMTFEQALVKANQFYEENISSGNAVAAHTLHYNGQLTICPVGDVYTVGHALHAYIEWKRIAGAASTFHTTLSLVNYHLVPRISGIPLEEFNGKHFHQLCVDVLETPPKRGARRLGPRVPISNLNDEELRKRKKTLNTLISILRVAFSLAWERGDLNIDRPTRCLRLLPNYDRPRSDALTRSECTKLLEACDPATRNLVAAALYTGCRVGELAALKVRDVARECFGIYIARSKNHRTRHVFLPREGMAFFLNLCQGKNRNDLVLLSPNGLPWNRTYRHALTKALGIAKLDKYVTFHTLRHTYASQLVEDGTPLSIVARQLGHSSTSTVDKVYGHLSPTWSEATIGRHFAPLLDKIELASGVHTQLETLIANPTGLARTDAHRHPHRPPSKSDTMMDELLATSNAGHDRLASWPRSNFSRFQGPLLELIAPKM